METEGEYAVVRSQSILKYAVCMYSCGIGRCVRIFRIRAAKHSLVFALDFPVISKDNRTPFSSHQSNSQALIMKIDAAGLVAVFSPPKGNILPSSSGSHKLSITRTSFFVFFLVIANEPYRSS